MFYKLNPLTQYKSDSPFNLASAKRLRTYLYTLINGSIDTNDADTIANLLGVGTTAEDVIDAISFWSTLYVFIPVENTSSATNSNKATKTTKTTKTTTTTTTTNTSTVHNLQEYIHEIGFCRRLSNDEINIVQQWYNAEKNILLVSEAYKRTVKNTGKSNVMYMNKMLLNWQRQCIYTLDDLNFIEKTLLTK